MSNIALPFLTMPESAILEEQFLVGPKDSPLGPAQDFYHGWDYAQDLDVRVHLAIDFDGAARALDTRPEGLELSAILHAGTGPGTVARVGWELIRGAITREDHEVTLAATIPGKFLSARLQLTLTVVLGAIGSSRSPLSPHVPGSQLWSSRRDILLEDGGDARFPVELTSFQKTFAGQLHSAAPWYVDWRPNSLEADFGGSVRVYVNSDIESLKQRFAEGDQLTLQAILADVMGQMISSVILQDDPDALLSQCSEGSVGQQVQFWLDSAFPGHSITAVNRIMLDRPQEFRAAILALSSMEGY